MLDKKSLSRISKLNKLIKQSDKIKLIIDKIEFKNI